MTRSTPFLFAALALVATACGPKAQPPEVAPEIETEAPAAPGEEGPRDVVEETRDPAEEDAPDEALETPAPESPETPEVDDPTDDVPRPRSE